MKHKKTLALILAAATVFTLFAGTLAFFTDRLQGSVTATAGTLDLDLSDFETAPKTAELRPGEGVSIEFTLSNKGNKSADVLETLVLSTTAPMTTVDGAMEFELYNAADVDLVDGVATPKAGATPLAARTTGTYTADEKTYTKITYQIPEFVLSGVGAGKEVEFNGQEEIPASKDSSYVLVFSKRAGNAFQGVTVVLDYEAQAKQHRNTDASTWTLVKSETITFGGDAGYKAVPVKAAP